MQLNVLIVDDSPSALLNLEAQLMSLGLESITCCPGGKEVLALVDADPAAYQLILVDLHMPEMDGVELIKHLGKRNFTGGLGITSSMDMRVIELSADLGRGYGMNIVGCLKKPIDNNDLAFLLSHAHRGNTPFERPQAMTEDEISTALRDKHLVPYYQPKVDIRTGELKGLEVLARIAIPGQVDAVLPGRFIPTAENSGLINRLTYQLLDEAFRQVPDLDSFFGHEVTLAINLSPKQLNDAKVPNKLLALLKAYKLKPAQVVIEITEQQAIETTLQHEVLNRLRLHGFGLALDDFGSGFTNMQQLRSLPFTEIKIDIGLVRDVHKDSLSQAIINTVLSIAKELNMSVVAEGVESPADLEYFQGLGDEINLQGFVVSKPKPLADILRWYTNWQRVQGSHSPQDVISKSSTGDLIV